MALESAVSLRDFGSFFAGGRPIGVSGQPAESVFINPALPAYHYDPNGDFHIEQAYVQYFIPERRVSAVPVVLLHGGGMTGVTWESTPDGRPGWLHRFLQAGFAVYVIDNMERGRAGWCAISGEWPGAPLMRSAREAWSLFRLGGDGGFAARVAFDGQRFPLAAFDTLTQQFVPRWPTTRDAHVDAVSAVLRRTGPAVLIGHSQGGDIAQRVVLGAPDLVAATVVIEAGGFPGDLGDADIGGHRFLYLLGDFLEATPAWVILRARGLEVCRALTKRGAKVDYVELPDQGIHGNTHMMMMDDNSDEIAALVERWILANV